MQESLQILRREVKSLQEAAVSWKDIGAIQRSAALTKEAETLEQQIAQIEEWLKTGVSVDS